jgi:hypothetical protein
VDPVRDLVPVPRFILPLSPLCSSIMEGKSPDLLACSFALLAEG